MQVEKYRLQLELLREGRLVEAMAVRTGGNSATKKAVKSIEDAAGNHLPAFTPYVPPFARSCILSHGIPLSLIPISPRMTSCEGCRT